MATAEDDKKSMAISAAMQECVCCIRTQTEKLLDLSNMLDDIAHGQILTISRLHTCLSAVAKPTDEELQTITAHLRSAARDLAEIFPEATNQCDDADSDDDPDSNQCDCKLLLRPREDEEKDEEADATSDAADS